MTMAYFRLGQGADLPRHSHPHEQTGYLVSGELTLTIGDETRQVKPGDSWCIAGDVEHKATAVEEDGEFVGFMRMQTYSFFRKQEHN